MTQELSDIRRQIDAIDDQVHDLLMQRASLVTSVAAAKKKDGLQIVQPAREARMIRRLLGRHKGPLPQATIVRIWRELVGSVSLLQTGLTVAVAAQDGTSALWDMAKNYFGAAVPMKKINGALPTLSAVAGNEVSFGVMPWPEPESDNAWWIHLFGEGQAALSAICALPYGSELREEYEANPRALVVSKIAFMPSDQDISFIGLVTTTSISKARLSELGMQAGFDVLNTYGTHTSHDTRYFYLCEVDGFIAVDDARISALRDGFGGQCVQALVVGGYPDIPVLKKPEVF